MHFPILKSALFRTGAKRKSDQSSDRDRSELVPAKRSAFSRLGPVTAGPSFVRAKEQPMAVASKKPVGPRFVKATEPRETGESSSFKPRFGETNDEDGDGQEEDAPSSRPGFGQDEGAAARLTAEEEFERFYGQGGSSSVAPPKDRGFDGGRRTKGIKLAVDPSDPLSSSLVLVRLDWTSEDDEHPCNLLSRSAAFCKLSSHWDFEPHPSGGTRCRVKIDQYQVSSAVAPTKNEARDAAAKKAVDSLDRRCYTVRVKNKYLGDGSVVDNSELSGDGAKGKEKELGGDNVGHRLLRLMGWTGGGLGKGGAGISEPVTATAISNREGLGSSCAGAEFRRRVRTLIEEYAASDNPYDLVFTSGFDNEQRKEMHMIAKRLGLKSKSFGKGDGRFLTISRKTDGRAIVNELAARGGQSEKYELVPPNRS